MLDDEHTPEARHPYSGSRNDHLINQDQSPGHHGKEDGDAIL
jgi:hypothetical protein